MSDKPFSNTYVVKETLRHMKNSVSISTAKTVARLPEFKGDAEKTAEVLTALANLSKLNNLIDSIYENNNEVFGDLK